jgi:hypothetical protein
MNKFIKEMRALKNKTSKELCANITNIETQKNLRIDFWLESSREKEKTQIEMKAPMSKYAKKNENFNMWKGCCTTRKVNMWYDDSI